MIRPGKEERDKGVEGQTGFWHPWDRGEGGIDDSSRKKEEGQIRD